MMYEIPEIDINGRSYLVKNIMEGDFEIDNRDIFALSVLDFCREWNSGKNSFIFHTSGSTGIPKSIEISRDQMIASAKQTIEFFKLERNDKVLLCLNPDFIGGKMMLVRAFVNNMKVVAITPSSNPVEHINVSQTLDFIALAPNQLFNILKNGDEKLEILERMKAVIVGGAPVEKSLQDLIEKLSVPVYSTYGMTETVSHVALKKLNQPDKTDFFVGLGGVEFGIDERNCLTIEGAVTNHQKLITNDLVDWMSRNSFRWIGRIDRVINTGGIKIHVDALERKIDDVLSKNDMYVPFFIFSLSDEVLGKRICMAVENYMGNTLELGEILNPILQKYENPKEIYSFKSFIMTPTGKIDRAKTIQFYCKDI